MDNGLGEPFNGSLGDEGLDVNWFLSPDDAREKIEKWRVDYNEFRPHIWPGNLTPRRFAEESRAESTSQASLLLAGTVSGQRPTRASPHLSELDADHLPQNDFTRPHVSGTAPLAPPMSNVSATLTPGPNIPSVPPTSTR